MKAAWLTPDDAPGAAICIKVYCPAGDAYEAALRGALLSLAEPENWEQIGVQTPDDVSQAYLDAFFQSEPWQECEEGGGGVVVAIGSVLQWAGGGDLPAGFLECDGAEYEETAYPDLFAIIGDTFGSSGAGWFNVPDFRSRVPVGVGAGPGLTQRLLADTGGEEAHVLTVNELAQHSHSVPLGNAGIIADQGAWYRALNLGPTNTSVVGLNAPHENMPPFLALRAIIAAFIP